MPAQAAFQHLLTQLRLIKLHLRHLDQTLRQPLPCLSLSLRPLRFIQYQLQMIEKMVLLLFGCSGTASSQQAYLTWSELVDQTNRKTVSLLSLTEAWILDPIDVQPDRLQSLFRSTD